MAATSPGFLSTPGELTLPPEVRVRVDGTKHGRDPHISTHFEVLR